MGVLNVTPDSFSDGGLYLDPGLAEAHALRMQLEGAHLVDVGGESTRPGASAVSAREEIRRVAPVLKRLVRSLQIPVSVDTYKEDVALAALDLGASVINDVRALSGGRRLARRIASAGAGVVLMHMQGNPRSMQDAPSYRDVVADVSAFLSRAAKRAVGYGIPADRIVIDPGFGFGKTFEHNLELLMRLDRIVSLGYPVLVGLSRKSMVGRLTGVGEPEGRLAGSLACAAVAIRAGASLLRVHDVEAHRQAAAVLDAVRTGGGLYESAVSL